MRRHVLYLHVISIALIYSVFAEDSRPNIVVIMADDLVSFIWFYLTGSRTARSRVYLGNMANDLSASYKIHFTKESSPEPVKSN
jgi:hypothetical protein